VQIILADEMPGLILAGLAARDPNAERLMLSVGRWLAAAAVATPGAGPLCGNHDCSTEFAGARLPGAFMITQAFGGADQAIVSGLCAACVERAAGAGGLRDLAVASWRKVMPDALPMADGGRA
jgi:hypothetical protein